MAGSNQAQQLQGMLSNLVNQFTMENMGGAATAYANNIRDYNAPKLDTDDAQSIMARQQWAQRNGYQKQATALGEVLGQRQAEDREREEDLLKSKNLATVFRNKMASVPEDQKADYAFIAEGLENGSITAAEGMNYLTGAMDPSKVRELKWYLGLDPEARKSVDNYMERTQIFSGGGGTAYARDGAGNVTELVSPEEAGDNAATTQTAEEKATLGLKQEVELSRLAATGRDNAQAYVDARQALRDGANTGKIANMFPDMREQNIALRQAVQEAGIGVIGEVTFGALSAEELKLALQVGIPTDMNEEQLAEWLDKKIAAMERLQTEYEEYITWRRQEGNRNKTVQDWEVETGKTRGSERTPAPSESLEGEGVKKTTGGVSYKVVG
jgi:hypothetical protein